MRNFLLSLLPLLSLFFSSCGNSVINGDEVNIDSTVTPTVYTFKSNGQKVTGSVEFYATDPSTGKKYKERSRELVNGIKVNAAFNYAPNGQVIASFPLQDGSINGLAKLYWQSGALAAEMEFKDDKENGTGKYYNEEGIQIGENIFQNGKIIKSYSFDEAGNKVIPITDYLSLEKCETGFYEYINYNNRELLYQPMVKMKWKNIGNQPLTERVQIKGVFVSDDEEWSTETDYFQGFSDAPLQPNLARQSNLQSSTGFKSYLGVDQSNVYCNIYVNDELYKKIKIARTLLTTNRIQ